VLLNSACPAEHAKWQPLPGRLIAALPSYQIASDSTVVGTIAFMSEGHIQQYHFCLRSPAYSSKQVQTSKESFPLQAKQQCSICQEEYETDKNAPLSTLPCGHIFHRHCVQLWLGCRASCPV